MPTESAESLLSAQEASINALILNSGHHPSQRKLMETARKLAAVESLPATIRGERPEAVREAAAYLEEERKKTKALYDKVGHLMEKSADAKDPLAILEASREAERISPLIEDARLEANVNAIYQKLGEALRQNRFSDEKTSLQVKGLLLFHDKEWDKARELWEEALRKGGPDPALEELLQRADENARREARQEKVLTLLSKGTAYHRSGQHEKAVKTLAALLEQDPSNADARRLLEASRVRLAEQQRDGEIEEALSLGGDFKRRRKYREASNQFLKALRLDPLNEEARTKLQEIVQALESEPLSAAGPRRAPKGAAADAYSPEKSEALYREGLAAYIQGEKGKAKGLWEGSLRANPDHKKARAALEQVIAEEKFLSTPQP